MSVLIPVWESPSRREGHTGTGQKKVIGVLVVLVVSKLSSSEYFKFVAPFTSSTRPDSPFVVVVFFVDVDTPCEHRAPEVCHRLDMFVRC